MSKLVQVTLIYAAIDCWPNAIYICSRGAQHVRNSLPSFMLVVVLHL